MKGIQVGIIRGCFCLLLIMEDAVSLVRTIFSVDGENSLVNKDKWAEVDVDLKEKIKQNSENCRRFLRCIHSSSE